MKRLNQFTKLPQEDQTLILNLCDKLPYKEVAATLAKPRAEGGLALTTGPSSLCKFYTRHHKEMIALESIGQFAAALQINHQVHGEANFQAILSLVQTRLLEALRAGTPIDDLQKYFRTLERVQKCFLTDEKFRHQNDQNDRTHEAYLTHIKKIAPAHGEDPDFIDHTVEKDPGARHSTLHDFADDPTQWEQDIEFAKQLRGLEIVQTPTFLRAAGRIISRSASENRTFKILKANKLNPAFASPELQDPTPESLLALQKKLEAAEIAAHKQNIQETQNEISTQPTPKTPAISTISTNFQSLKPPIL